MSKLTHAQAMELAKSEWDAVWRIFEWEVPRDGVPAPGSQLEREAPGKKIIQQWKVHLHSTTGPVHWIAILDDGSAHIK